MKIIFQDKDLIVVDKPAKLKVYGKDSEDSLMKQLINDFPDLISVGISPRYGLIHRLDKETSGVILVARNQSSLSFFQKQFLNRQVNKTYMGLIHGHINPKNGILKSFLTRSPKDFRKQKAIPIPLSGQERVAETIYKTKEEFSKYTLLEIKPKTGRMHQIRAQMAWKGCPIVGDQLYQFKGQTEPACLKRMFLHSMSIKIAMPNQQERLFQAELPEELKEVINCLS